MIIDLLGQTFASAFGYEKKLCCVNIQRYQRLDSGAIGGIAQPINRLLLRSLAERPSLHELATSSESRNLEKAFEINISLVLLSRLGKCPVG